MSLPPAVEGALREARTLRQEGRHADALLAFDEAAHLASTAGDAVLSAKTQIGKIDSLGMLGRYDEAFALGESTISTLEALGAEAEAARARCNVGNLYWRCDRYDEALLRYESATRTFEALGDTLALALTATNRANALAELGRIDEALPLHEQARDAYTARAMEVEAAEVETNIGYLHHASGRPVAALAALARARRTFQAKGRLHEDARAALDAAEASLALNLWPEALTLTESALESFARLPLPDDEAHAHALRAAALAAQNQVGEARVALSLAEKIYKRRHNGVRLARVRLMRASLPGGSPEDARAAARTFARRKLAGWAAEARFLQGGHTLRSLQAIRRAAQKNHRGWLECRALRALAPVHAEAGRPRRALACLREAVQVLEAARTQIAPEELHLAYLSDKLEIYEALIDALLTRGGKSDLAEVLSVIERAKSRLLLERVLGQQAPLAPEAEALRAQLSRAYREEHALESADPDDPRRFRPQARPLATLERAWDDALKAAELQHRGGTLLAGFSGVDLRELQAALRTDESLVVYFSTQEKLGALVISARKISAVRELASLEMLRHAARRLRYQLQKPERETPLTRLLPAALQAGADSVLRELYDSLLRPLESLLPGEKVTVVPHGPLHGLPLHALLDGSCPALERWEILTVPSAALYLTLKNRPASTATGALLLGVPAPGIERIASEIEAIAKGLPGARVETGQRASGAVLSALAPTLKTLHIATHARFRDDNPLFSGLKLADGWLLARDLYNLKLDAELVTLSACQTAQASVAPGEELLGLTRGFLAAGTRRVAASLWPADDEATTALMTHFYALLPTMTPAAALRQAQRTLRKRFPHPYHWAAFTLAGIR